MASVLDTANNSSFNIILRKTSRIIALNVLNNAKLVLIERTIAHLVDWVSIWIMNCIAVFLVKKAVLTVKGKICVHIVMKNLPTLTELVSTTPVLRANTKFKLLKYVLPVSQLA